MRSLPWTRFAVGVRRFVVHHPIARWVAVGVLALAVARTVDTARRAADDARARWSTTRSVLVASASIAPGEPLDASVTELRELPVAVLPSTALVARPAGAVATDGLAPGEVVLAGHVAAAGASGTLTPGTSGVPLPLPVGWTPTVGQRIAVVSTGDPTGLSGASGAGVVAASGTVLAVRDDGLLVAVPDEAVAAVAGAGADGRAVVVLLPG